MMMMKDSITITQQLYGSMDCRMTTLDSTPTDTKAVVIKTGVGFPAGVLKTCTRQTGQHRRANGHLNRQSAIS